jgi:hypothetical protein
MPGEGEVFPFAADEIHTERIFFIKFCCKEVIYLSIFPRHNLTYVSNAEENEIFLISLQNRCEFTLYTYNVSIFGSCFNFLQQ